MGVSGQVGAKHGGNVTVEQARIQEPLHDQSDAAVTVQVGHDVLPGRFHVGDVRGVAADTVEIVQGQFDINLMGDRYQVQH